MVDAKFRSGLIGMLLGIAGTMYFSPIIKRSLFAADSADTDIYIRMEAPLRKEQINSRTIHAELIGMTSNLQTAQREDKIIAVTPKESDAETVQYIRPEIFRPGVIILGMHRSGTSLVSSLINKMGLKTGGPLLEVSEDNEKGLYERSDIVVQNDLLFSKQNMLFHHRTSTYDDFQGLKDILNLKDDTNFFHQGKNVLSFLNDKSNYPWMLKDPRLCLTLKTWLPFINISPSILFVFRHPYDVALSLHKRDPVYYDINKVLKMWYIHNKKAILTTNDLCRVIASHEKIMKEPLMHFDRIYKELKSCGVRIPHKLKSKDVSTLIDSTLQHWNNKIDSCYQNISTLLPPELPPPVQVLNQEKIHRQTQGQTRRKTGTEGQGQGQGKGLGQGQGRGLGQGRGQTKGQGQGRKQKLILVQNQEPIDISLYRTVMRAHCAMEDGTAFSSQFLWDQTISDADYNSTNLLT